MQVQDACWLLYGIFYLCGVAGHKAERLRPLSSLRISSYFRMSSMDRSTSGLGGDDAGKSADGRSTLATASSSSASASSTYSIRASSANGNGNGNAHGNENSSCSNPSWGPLNATLATCCVLNFLLLPTAPAGGNY